MSGKGAAAMVRSAGRLVTVVWAVAGLACAGSSVTPATSPTSATGEPGPTTVTAPPLASATAWVAVFDTAADPQDLSDGRAGILATVGEAMAGAVVVSPADCLEGLPDGVAVGGYVLAIQDGERSAVTALTEQLDGNPSFVGEVTVVCTD